MHITPKHKTPIVVTCTTMIPSISNAKETTEEMRKAFKNLYANAVSCSDLSAIQSITLPDGACKEGGWKLDGCKEGSGRDMEGAVTLDWRADPFESMSDLTLVVYDGSGGVPYHVHTILMAFGGRRSGFVVDQMKQQQKKSGGSKQSSSSGSKNNTNAPDGKEYTIEIYVPALAAKYIPTLLDYIYGSTLRFTTSNAPPIRYLSNKFDIRDLHTQVSKSFISQDLELNTAPQYCIAADELKDFELRDKALRIMAERMERMNVNLLNGMSPRLMRSLVQCDKLECGGVVLSEKVAIWLRCRDAAEKEGSSVIPLTDEDFYWLTHVQLMPQVSPHEALFYLNYGANYPQVMNEIGPGSIKSRCLAACSGSWALDNLTAHLDNPEKRSMKLYENLEMDMKVQVLESSLVGAKKLMGERDQLSSSRDVRENDVQLSDEIMYQSIQKQYTSSSKVSKVIVMGAGIAPANGVYIYNPNSAANKSQQKDFPNMTIYEKEAVWNQSRVTFVLYPTSAGQYYTQYKLAVRLNNKMIVFYNSPTVMGVNGVSSRGESGAPLPEQGWEVEGEGVHPPPQFVGKIEQPVSIERSSLTKSV